MENYIIILFGLLSPCCLSRRYFYQTQLLTWDEAEQNCQNLLGNLATFERQEDIDSIQRPAGLTEEAWIGLRDEPSTWQHMGNASTSWRWSETGKISQSQFSSWASAEPNNYWGESCVSIDMSGFWMDKGCESMFASVCVSNSTPTYVHNPVSLKWSDAQEFCRQNYRDLVSIENEIVNADVKNLVPFLQEAWIGLYRIPFAWADHSPSTFRNWAPDLPDNYWGVEFCATEYEQRTWNDQECNTKLPSVCAKPDWETRKTTVRQTMSSTSDLSQPEILQKIQQKLTEMVGQGRTDVQIKMRIVMIKKTGSPQQPQQSQCSNI